MAFIDIKDPIKREETVKDYIKKSFEVMKPRCGTLISSSREISGERTEVEEAKFVIYA